ncbi:HAMP domain-containing sensor histidine kinase [Paenibacillus woosongensis]|uniref:histidine kinase n=1 Tax=Paenibacillus woosongensis TaxID=307580 RepID=A0AA95I5G1_9BACL|nr:HAMP domain-containing sensor histidine kinase [Paenibacillus woosongensis]WHX49276.1 HAMP domain-containing sensor histidine kinase [Paenibacillus woosongensis]
MRFIKQSPLQRLRTSLLSRYVLIIVTALVFIPVLIPASFMASWAVNRMLMPGGQETYQLPYGSAYELEQMWHKHAKALAAASPAEIDARLSALKEEYPDAALFWVDGAGITQLQLPVQAALPKQWSAEDTIAFMKAGINADPYTVVALIGGDEQAKQGFMVFELPRSYLTPQGRPSDSRFYGLFMALIFGIFILLSYLFFRDIRKRLLRLEAAMTRVGENGLPSPTEEGRPDEIGRLEQAFNHMVNQLEEGRRRERKEEELRKNLIANLSHDLRTPLTVLAGHLYSMGKEPLSAQGRQSLALMEAKLDDLDHLIDHLLSYNLLTSGKYALSMEQQDVHRIVRESAAAWYPVWEKAGMSVDIDLPDEPLRWAVDTQGFRRVLDNLFQNVVRHAGSGKYVGIHTARWKGYPALIISDRGPGLDAASAAKGAGLGLAIVELLLREMGLRLDAESSAKGTRFVICPAS